MSWADLLIQMNVLFVLPALLAAAVLAWQAACSAARLYRSAETAGRAGSTGTTLLYGRHCGPASKFHRT